VSAAPLDPLQGGAARLTDLRGLSDEERGEVLDVSALEFVSGEVDARRQKARTLE
jgi:hypothetical protein